jgi:hypothetical protein
MKRRVTVVDGPLAFGMRRFEAARANDVGLKVLTLPLLASRLAGGFRHLADRETLSMAVGRALQDGGFAQIDGVRHLPGMVRAALQSLDRSWSADLDLDDLAYTSARVADLVMLQRRVSEALPHGATRACNCRASRGSSTVSPSEEGWNERAGGASGLPSSGASPRPAATSDSPSLPRWASSRSSAASSFRCRSLLPPRSGVRSPSSDVGRGSRSGTGSRARHPLHRQRTSARSELMSVPPSTADIVRPAPHVRFVPTRDSCTAATATFVRSPWHCDDFGEHT